MSTYITDKIDLAENMKKIRESFGLTQDELAKILYLDRTSFSYYERGKVQPSIFTLIKLATYLNIPLDCFFIKGGGNLQLKIHEQI